MKKYAIPLIMILVLSLFAGCNGGDKATPGEEEPAAEEPAAEEPAAEEPASGDEFGGIVTNSYYYWNGDPEQDSFYFYDDGAFEYNDTPDLGISTGTWAQEGERLTLTTDTHTQGLPIEDGGETIITPEGERMMLEGSGAGSEDEAGSGDEVSEASAGSVNTDDAYYWEAQYYSNSLHFFTDNTIFSDLPGRDFREGVWSATDDMVTITWNDTGEVVEMSFAEGGDVLVDAAGTRFSVNREENTTPSMGGFYRNKDENADFIFVYAGSQITHEFPDGEIVEGTFFIETDVITITWNDSGETVAMKIEDGGRTFVDEEGVRFTQLY